MLINVVKFCVMRVVNVVFIMLKLEKLLNLKISKGLSIKLSKIVLLIIYSGILVCLVLCIKVWNMV